MSSTSKVLENLPQCYTKSCFNGFYATKIYMYCILSVKMVLVFWITVFYWPTNILDLETKMIISYSVNDKHCEEASSDIEDYPVDGNDNSIDDTTREKLEYLTRAVLESSGQSSEVNGEIEEPTTSQQASEKVNNQSDTTNSEQQQGYSKILAKLVEKSSTKVTFSNSVEKESCTELCTPLSEDISLNNEVLNVVKEPTLKKVAKTVKKSGKKTLIKSSGFKESVMAVSSEEQNGLLLERLVFYCM